MAEAAATRYTASGAASGAVTSTHARMPRRSSPSLLVVGATLAALGPAVAAGCAHAPRDQPAAPPAPPAATAAAGSAPRDSAPGRWLAVVRPDFSGERARDVTGYVEHWFRLPGNPGFDASIDRVAAALDSAGFVRTDSMHPDSVPKDARLTYRIERYGMRHPTWDPEEARLEIEGESEPVLRFATNRNMLAINSYSTAERGVSGQLVYAGRGTPAELDRADVRGRIVMADAHVGPLFTEAVLKRGAAGVLAYAMPAYTKPEVNRTAIQFSQIPLDVQHQGWAILLSYAARERLLDAIHRRALSTVRLHVWTRTRIYDAAERVLVAEVRGSRAPDERFVISAHVQEPGANDNASGVGGAVEMARVLGQLVRDGRADPGRTITFIWGDEVRAVDRWLAQNSRRRKGVKWGLSLDMIGEDTRVTGGTFLIEKMPDPSAIWTRGDDHHTEWGGESIGKRDLRPSYYNDFIRSRAREQAAATGWKVRTNPFEGGSDHTPFLEAGKPGALFWHFTDQFYHTDLDRLDKVSAAEIANVGVTALGSALALATADGPTAREIIRETTRAAVARLTTEARLSADTLRRGGSRDHEREILDTWRDYYVRAVLSAGDIEPGGPSTATQALLAASAAHIQATAITLEAALP